MTDAKNKKVSKEKNIVVVEKEFRNPFTHLFYELYQYGPSFFWFLMLGAMWLIFARSMLSIDNSLSDVAGFVFVTSIFASLFSIPAFIMYSDHKLNTESKLKFCKEVITNKPASNINTWLLISQNMNKFLYENKYWHTPYYFCDGHSAEHYFDLKFIKRYPLTPNFSADEDSDESPMIKNSKTPARKIHYTEDDAIDKYIKKAIAIHKNSLNDYYKSRYSEYEL